MHGLIASRQLLLRSALAAPAIIFIPHANANTLTGLIPDLYAGLDVVSRERVGFIPSVFRNVGAERAAVNQYVDYHISQAQSAFNVTPAMAIPDPADKTTGMGQMRITKSRGVEFGWTGEEQTGLNTGAGYLSVQADNFAQALRTLCNEIEVDLAVEAAANASRATGTAGTTPFASNLDGTADVRQILDDNGAPLSDRSLIINTSAGNKMRKNTQLTKANEAGTIMTLRQGELLDVHGFSIKESAGIQTVGASTAASATTDNAGYAIGAKVITLAAAGTGIVTAGTNITFAGDANVYKVVSGDADVSNGGTITLAEPGLRVAMSAATKAITVVAAHAGNIAFTRSALHLVARPPKIPAEGDAAADRRLIVDPRSGLAFEVAIYLGYRKVRLEVVLAWGVKAVAPRHIAELMG